MRERVVSLHASQGMVTIGSLQLGKWYVREGSHDTGDTVPGSDHTEPDDIIVKKFTSKRW